MIEIPIGNIGNVKELIGVKAFDETAVVQVFDPVRNFFDALGDADDEYNLVVSFISGRKVDDRESLKSFALFLGRIIAERRDLNAVFNTERINIIAELAQSENDYVGVGVFQLLIY